MAQVPKDPPRRVGRLRLAEAQGLRQKILDVAIRLFRRNGYAGTSVDGIAAAAGISKRSVYSRFANKTVLFAAVIESVVRQITLPPIEIPSDATLACILTEAAQRLVRAPVHPIMLAVLQFVTLDAEPQQELAAAARTAGLVPIVGWLGDLLLAQGVAAGDDRQRRFLAEALFTLLVMAPRLSPAQAGGARSATAEQGRPLEETLAATIALFVTGCDAPGPGHRSG